MIDLRGKVAIITGASRGIGAATALRFADAGASLVLNYFKHEGEAERVAQEARKRGARAITVRADISRFEDVRALFEQTLAEFGRFDILVANAGIWISAAIEDLDESAWNRRSTLT